MAILRKVLHGYRLAGPNGPITLRSRQGWRPSDRSTPNGDVTHAVRTSSGYKVLLSGDAAFEDKFSIWNVNRSGIITSRTGWKTSTTAASLNWEHTFSTDLDNNGLISGGASYRLAGPNGPITLRSRQGWRPSDRSTPNGDVTHAVRTSSGYKVLFSGDAAFEDKFSIWNVNRSGIITSRTDWKSIRKSLNDGWESTFGDVILQDGAIGIKDDFGDNIDTEGKIEINRPKIGDLEVASDHDWFAISLAAGKQYQFDIFGVTLADPYLYLRRPDGSLIGSDDDSGAGRNARLRLNITEAGDYYLDVGAWANRGKGRYIVSVVEIAPVDDGDASFLIRGTPEIGNTLTIARTADDPDGNGSSPTITWQSSSDGNSWATVATGSQLTLTDAFAGQQLRATVSYIDGENFSEQVFTNTVEVVTQPVDDGDASFLIRGTPEIGNTLTIARTADDPDGNGSSPTITWQSSSDGNSWATVATGSQLTLTDAFAGQQLRATVSYIDGENFSEQVFTNTVEVVSSGDDFPGSVDTDGAVAIDASTTGELEDRADRDWFAVQLEAGERYRFDLVGNTLQDPYLYLRGAAGELLTDDDDGGSGLNSQITFQATVNGRYFLDAGAYADSYTGTYTLSATQLAPPDPGGDDFPGSVDTDGAVAIDASTTGELEDRADRDWFAVQLEAGERYRFDLVGNTLQDPYLYLRGAAGELLTDDDDGGSGLNSQITFQATVNGRYFLDAGAYADSYTGTYTLSATQLAPPDPGFNSTDGYGHVDAKRAFENLLDISLSDVPELGGNLWGLDNVNAPEVWAGGEGFSGVTGENVTIAVIDTGVDSNHSEFNGRMVAGYDFVDDDTT
ncbi:pre-peptidase C-terminal domain-containing protein, partial [Synechococcus sp. AH-736-G21]|nr:pre-peptidase C-terminal domain-containing protein [Synechococcus sp. AH-736-G21]